MKKITFFTIDIYPAGGTEKAISIIANELVNFYEVTIISFRHTSNSPFFYFDPRINIINVDYKKETEPLRKKAIFIRHFLKKYLKNYKTDYFVCAGMRYVPITIFMRKRSKYIAWEHYSSFGKSRFTLTGIGRCEAARKAHKVIVLTKKEKKRYITFWKAKEDKVVQIYNPIEKLKSENFDYDVNSKQIITVGRLCSEKGLDKLVEVAKIVKKSHPDWKWDIYGDGNKYEALKQMILENELQEFITLKGRVKNINDLYRKYAFYVMTSTNEGFPMVLIEAHTSKLPIVSFDIN
jgi:glycosyltransferase involved in cell wall biosynthesis